MRIRVDPSVIVNCIICRKEVSEELWPFCSKACVDYDTHMQEEYLKFLEYQQKKDLEKLK